MQTTKSTAAIPEISSDNHSQGMLAASTAIAIAATNGTSRDPNQRPGRMPDKNAPKYTTGSAIHNCQAGTVIDQKNGAAIWPGVAAHQA